MILGIGTDICEVSRVEDLLEKSGQQLIDRILTLQEQEVDITPAYLARRFAGKEAIAKAFGSGIGEKFAFHDVSIIRAQKDRPRVILSKKLQKKYPDVVIHLSLSDEARYAVAFALIEQRVPTES